MTDKPILTAVPKEKEEKKDSLFQGADVQNKLKSILDRNPAIKAKVAKLKADKLADSIVSEKDADERKAKIAVVKSIDDLDRFKTILENLKKALPASLRPQVEVQQPQESLAPPPHRVEPSAEILSPGRQQDAQDQERVARPSNVADTPPEGAIGPGTLPAAKQQTDIGGVTPKQYVPEVSPSTDKTLQPRSAVSRTPEASSAHWDKWFNTASVSGGASPKEMVDAILQSPKYAKLSPNDQNALQHKLHEGFYKKFQTEHAAKQQHAQAQRDIKLAAQTKEDPEATPGVGKKVVNLHGLSPHELEQAKDDGSLLKLLEDSKEGGDDPSIRFSHGHFGGKSGPENHENFVNWLRDAKDEEGNLKQKTPWESTIGTAAPPPKEGWRTAMELEQARTRGELPRIDSPGAPTTPPPTTKQSLPPGFDATSTAVEKPAEDEYPLMPDWRKTNR